MIDDRNSKSEGRVFLSSPSFLDPELSDQNEVARLFHMPSTKVQSQSGGRQLIFCAGK